MNRAALVVGILMTVVGLTGCPNSGQAVRGPETADGGILPDVKTSLEPGNYELRIIIPSHPVGDQDNTLPVKVTVDGEKLVIDSRVTTEVPFQAVGSIGNGRIDALWNCEDQGEHVTYRFEGEVSASNHAEGVLSFVTDGQTTAYGTWLLSIPSASKLHQRGKD